MFQTRTKILVMARIFEGGFWLEPKYMQIYILFLLTIFGSQTEYAIDLNRACRGGGVMVAFCNSLHDFMKDL